MLTRDGKQIGFHGKILIVWKKQKDGSWKIFRYMFDEIPAKKLSTSHWTAGWTTSRAFVLLHARCASRA